MKKVIVKQTLSHFRVATKWTTKVLAFCLAACMIVAGMGLFLNLLDAFVDTFVHVPGWLSYILGIGTLALLVGGAVVIVMAVSDFASILYTRKSRHNGQDENIPQGRPLTWCYAIVLLLAIIALLVLAFATDSVVVETIGNAILSLTQVDGHEPANVAIVVYGLAAVCIASCVSLFFPLIKDMRSHGFSEMVLSGVISTVLYTAGVINFNFYFLYRLIGGEAAWQWQAFLSYLTGISNITTAYGLMHSWVLPIFLFMTLNVILYRRISFGLQEYHEELAEEERIKAEKKAAEEAEKARIEAERKRQEAERAQREAELDESRKEMKLLSGDDLWFFRLTMAAVSLSQIAQPTGDLAAKMNSPFHHFHPDEVAKMTDEEAESIATGDNGIKSPDRIRAVIKNAQAFVKVQEEFDSFDAYLRQFVNDDTSADAQRLSDNLHARGFKYIGPSAAAQLLLFIQQPA